MSNEYGVADDRYEYDAFGVPYAGDLGNGMDLGYTGKPYDVVTGLYNYGYRDYKPEAARFTTVDPIRDGSNWFAYVNNDPVNFIDLWGLAEIIANDIFGKPIIDLPNISVEKRTTLEVVRGINNEPNEEYNDTLQIKIGGQILQQYTGVQSEKNYATPKIQSYEERFDADLKDKNYPNVTLPNGKYDVTFEKGITYEGSLRITSPSIQLPGVEKEGVLAEWGFLIHSMSDKNKERIEAFSSGCIIMPDDAFKGMRTQLEGLGLENKDTISLNIRSRNRQLKHRYGCIFV